VTDVRLKRFARDYIASKGNDILVGDIEGKTTNLTGRVAHYLAKQGKRPAKGCELVNIILSSFVDARWFGSALAFKEQDKWKPEPEPKTLTGAVQFNMGEVIHEAEEIIIPGTSVFASEQDKTQGTFTTYAALRYALIAFHGVANEHSAKKSCMTNKDYDLLLEAIWKGVRSAGNTRTKVGQVPRLLISVEYRPTEEFQFGNLMDYVKLEQSTGKPEREWASPADYVIDLSLLRKRFREQTNRIEKIRYESSPDIFLKDKETFPDDWQSLRIDDARPTE
jgi:CRISPR-associated protein Csh2